MGIVLPIQINTSGSNSVATSHPGFNPEKFYTNTTANRSVLRSDGGYANNFYFSPIFLPKCNLTGIGCDITDNSGIGKKLRMGIYTAKDGVPKDLIFSTVEIPVETNSEKIVTLEKSLPGGQYFTAYLASDTFRIASVHENDCANTGYLIGVDLPGDKLPAGLRYEFPYGEMPQVFNPEDLTKKACTRSPLIFFRLSVNA